MPTAIDPGSREKRLYCIRSTHNDASTLSLTSRMPTSYNTLHNGGIKSLRQSFYIDCTLRQLSSQLATFSGIGTGPPGESAVRAVRISQPSSVTRSVCSIKAVSGMSHKQ